MKIFAFLTCFFVLTGCSKVSNIANNAREPDITGDPIYDSQTEFKLLVPWDWMVYDIKNVKKTPANTGDFWY